MTRQRALRGAVVSAAVAAAIVALTLLAVRREYFLVFHSLVETFIAAVGVAVFMMTWNARRFQLSGALTLLGVALLAVSILTFFHTVSYKINGQGTPGLESFTSDLPTQLWIISRIMLALTFIAVPFVLRRPLPLLPVVLVYLLATALGLLSTLYWRNFPTCWDNGVTEFKKACEYVISGAFVAGAVLLGLRRRDLDPMVLWLLMGAVLLMAVSDLLFTGYVQTDDFTNAVGHYLQLAAFFLVYKAIVETGLSKPYNLLFRNLKQSEAALRELADELENRVQHRTAALQQTVETLRAEMAARQDAERAHQAAEEARRLEQAERLKLAEIVEASDEAIISESLDGTIISWNRGAQSMYGYTAAEMRGKSIRVIIPRDLHREFDELLRHVREGHRVENVETLRCRKDGHVIWVSLSISPIRDAQGTVVALAAVARDITEHRRLEAEVLMTTELERQRIGHDLHDTLGQHLTGTAFLCNVLRNRLHKTSPADAQEVQTIESLVNEGVALTRSLARGLSPIGLKEDSLMMGLKQLCTNIEEMFRVRCEFKSTVSVLIHDVPTATHVYRIAQEAMNNAMRHGKAKTIHMELTTVDGAFVMAIEDDGIGLPEDTPRDQGMGLRIMNYRARTIGAGLEIRRRSEGGTCVICTLRRSEHVEVLENPTA